MSVRRARSLAPLIAALLAASACGSTVKGAGAAAGSAAAGLAQAQGSDGSGLSASVTGNGSAAAPGSVIGGGAAVGTGSRAGGAAVGAATSTPGADAAGRVATAPGQGMGVTAKAVYIGLAYTENADQANAALGLSAITSGNEKADDQAVIDEINAHGGVAGRKLVPVYHAYDANSQDTDADQDQAACADFTEDHKVFAVAAVGLTETFTSCLRKHGVLQVASGQLIDQDKTFFDRYPSYVNLSVPTQDRMMAEMANALARMKYFTGWDPSLARPGTAKANVGVIGFDDPAWHNAVNKSLLPGLKRLGHPVAPPDVVYVHVPASTAENGASFQQISNAVLKFRSAGVTHVIMLDTNGGLTLLFTKDANSQSYYPRLGVNSGTGMQGLYDAHAFDDKMLAGAVGLGWAPSIDLSAAQGDTYATAETKRCLKVMKDRTGQQFDSTNAASIALTICDGINLIARAVADAGSVIDLSTGVAAIERLGSGFLPAFQPAAFLGPGRHDGVEMGYDLMWDGSCSCAKYVGKGRRIP